MAIKVPVYIALTKNGMTRWSGVPLASIIDMFALDQETGRYTGPWTIIYPTSGKPAATHLGVA